ncbi:MAG: hypothetical protein ACLP3C_16935 [Mycobacterium sp.]|uniref:hypothetical protein n=1 Tax=Mycobacterium sp. TaxID=1785 RepID=UPI003F9B2FC3
MTTSLAFCANNGISLLDDPVNEQTVTQVTHVYRGHQPTYLRAQQIPATVASRTSSCATTASSPAEGETLDSSISTKDMR